jgi:hypothetical protein
LLSSTHVNDANYYAMQFSADFYGQNLYYRSTAGNGSTAWSKILHSGNYNDYAPSKAGAGATGTWAISITGNSNTVTTLNSGQIVSALGYTPVNPGALTNQSGTAINGTTATFSGQVNVSTSGIKFPNDPYGGSGDTASITYESVSGEKTRLRFRVANDAGITSVDDKAEFIVPDNDSLLVNGYVTLNAANYNSYSPTLSGGNASGTWGINITGSAGSAGSVAWNSISGRPNNFVFNDGNTYGINVTGNSGTATSSRFVQSPDGDRNPNNKLPITSGQSVRFDFANAGYVGTGGNYAGVMTYAPWTGTTASTGDASYQLAFGSTATNGSGTPQLRIRKGIDSTWNSWYDLLTSANYNNYSPTLTGGNASGTWGINITGNAGTVSSITTQQVVNALGFTPANQSDLTRVTTSPLQASNITTTGTLTVAQGSALGIRWPNDAFGGGGDTASITLETAGYYGSGLPAEATRMVLKVTNDAGYTGDKIAFDVPDANSVGILRVANNQVYPFYNWLNIAFTSGVSTSTSGFTNQVGSWNFGANYFDVYPPESYTMAHLVVFIPSIYIIHFAGGVNGDDSMVCTWSNLGDRIRVYVQNTEQRSTPGANWLAIWRIPLP